ncbi:patatin-like phospholipase domain-containing protein 2 isoform X2 [Cheilinus undulatus]|uniref:patatin-like phospholipase domain-containing protein 2 isoform X2 n=1 Tax=Cheilinus undulatus TaxID=241271 RepID=UPI001BD28F8C|nr:patatin-like phospholipase domain-containing protein 2 isoform X2 [Cheilinus undulatus]
MFNWDEEWNISFAGCGFRSVYYLGALSCIFERVPRLVHGASKIGGASSGCLVAAALVVGIPIEFFADVLTTAKKARKHTLGVFHPTFSLLQTAKDFLQQKLPEDAHLKSSGRLCVSLTRISDRKNVLVSEFESREELIQVLACSCFFPCYSAFIPPSYRGVYYMDGALSNNMPLFEHRNTITMAPFSGESDICPREGTFNFFEATFGNVSIQVNTGNVHRVCTSFLPPKPEKLAEICHNGYMDALHFLRERDLLETQNLQPSLEEMDTVAPCFCEPMESEETAMNEKYCHKNDQCWLNLKVIKNLPLSFKKVLHEACRHSHDGSSQLSEFPPVRMFLSLLTLLLLPIELLYLLAKRMLTLMAELCRRIWSRKSSSSHSDMRTQTVGDGNFEPLTPQVSTNSNITLHMDNNGNMEQLSLTITSTTPDKALKPNTSPNGTSTLKQRCKRINSKPSRIKDC